MRDREELTRLPDLTAPRGTAPVRTRRALYQDLLAPCNHACPAGEDVQGWLAHAQAGRLREAWETIVQDNPLPAVHGRVCYHPCESACNRAQLDGTVNIHAIERFLGDLALAERWPAPAGAPRSGRRVLIVGAGPSGLSAAYHLARLGHDPVMLEAGPVAGGMMHFGIPAYRLPRTILAAEVRRILDAGVELVLNHRVVDLLEEKARGGFDAVFVAVGAHLSKRVEIPSMDAAAFLDATAFLRQVDRGDPPRLGRRVAVYGGGNTAMDAARVALRMGSEPIIIYRRDRDHMPAHDIEADEALEEGVRIHWLRSITSADAASLTVEVMELDEKGRPRGTGRFERIEADDLILAVGQDTDTAFLRPLPGVEFDADGTVRVSPEMMTGHPGIFAGGDMVPAERTVTTAVGHGARAARHIDAYLRGTRPEPPDPRDIATFDLLHLWFYTDADQRVQSRADLRRRRTSFEEVQRGLSQADAVFEARRCLSCGNCFECDGCFAACPEDAIVKLGPGLRYRIDYDRCTGCAICVEQCPCHAMEMVPEPGLARAHGAER
jgi:formate dehydrogenase (NADP+) beta subunit